MNIFICTKKKKNCIQIKYGLVYIGRTYIYIYIEASESSCVNVDAREPLRRSEEDSGNTIGGLTLGSITCLLPLRNKRGIQSFKKEIRLTVFKRV
jgi:hypothetical protein